jgi:hypothetical protein
MHMDCHTPPQPAGQVRGEGHEWLLAFPSTFTTAGTPTAAHHRAKPYTGTGARLSVLPRRDHRRDPTTGQAPSRCIADAAESTPCSAVTTACCGAELLHSMPPSNVGHWGAVRKCGNRTFHSTDTNRLVRGTEECANPTTAPNAHSRRRRRLGAWWLVLIAIGSGSGDRGGWASTGAPDVGLPSPAGKRRTPFLSGWSLSMTRSTTLPSWGKNFPLQYDGLTGRRRFWWHEIALTWRISVG